MGEMIELSGVEYELYVDDVAKIVTEFIGKTVDIADKHNVDRDSAILHVSQLLSAMVSVSTFQDFEREGGSTDGL